MKKTESLNFNAFMKGNIVTNEKTMTKNTDMKLYSSILPFTVPYMFKTLFFHKGVLIVGSAGLLAITLAYLENRFSKKGHDPIADIISSVGAVVFPIIVGGTVIALIIKVCAFGL